MLLPIERISCDARIADGVGFRSILYFLWTGVSLISMPHGREEGISAHTSQQPTMADLRIDGRLEETRKVRASALKGALPWVWVCMHFRRPWPFLLLFFLLLFLCGIFEWFINSIFGARQD